MSIRRLTAAVFVPAVLLSGCASSAFGGSINSRGDALSPEERRLQAVETKAAELSRRLDSVNLAGMDQENQRLRDDIRSLRGEVERLRYDFEQQQRRLRDQYTDLDRRLQRFESPLGIAPSATAPGTVPPAGAVMPGMSGTLSLPPAAPGAVAPVMPPPVATLPPAPSVPPGAASSSPTPGAPVVISSGSGTVEEETAYLAAFDQLKNGKYDAAIRGFKTMLERWPQGAYAANAYFWMGEAQTVKRDYRSALVSFQTVQSRFPTSPKAPDALLKVGLTQIELKQESEGRATLQRVISSYPNSNAAKLAQQRLSPPR
jgi:tol-pal system protein YbgF